MKIFKFKLKEIFKQKDRSVTWLSQKTGISRPAISKIINGKTKGISFNSLESICNVLEITPNELFGYSNCGTTSKCSNSKNDFLQMRAERDVLKAKLKAIKEIVGSGQNE